MSSYKYESPITFNIGELNKTFDDSIMKALLKCDINVDKEELIKALEYDRMQYDKGYSDGKNDRPKGKWIEGTMFNVECGYKCSRCGLVVVNPKIMDELYNFCPNCGADMRGDSNDNRL